MNDEKALEMCSLVLQVKKSNGYPAPFTDEAKTKPSVDLMVCANFISLTVYPNGEADIENKWDFTFYLGETMNAQKKADYDVCIKMLKGMLRNESEANYHE